MCRLGRTRRKNYEGMDKKRCVERWERMKLAETRKWYESPRWKVEGNGDPDDRGLNPNQTDRTLKISQADTARKSKLIRFLRQLISQGRYSAHDECARKASEWSHHTNRLKCSPLKAETLLGLGDPNKVCDSKAKKAKAEGGQCHDKTMMSRKFILMNCVSI